MNAVIKRITIDVANENSFDWLEAIQGDSISRYVYISLLNNGVSYYLDQVVPVIRGEKSDGTTIFNSCQLTENGEIIVELTSQMLSAAGKSVYEVALYGTDMEVLTSFPFYLSVNPANFCPEKIVSTDEYTMIADIMKNVNNLYDAVDTATEQAEISMEKANEAASSAVETKLSELAATNSANIATEKAIQASNSATAAKTSESNTAISETNAKKYLDDMKEIADSFEGTLRPKGEILFENLPPVSTAKAGDMYTVTDHFITTADFTNGAGIEMPQYVSIYKAENGKWTALDGSLITGVKGECEDEYRIGKVVVTKSSIGLENADNTSDMEKPVSTAQQTALDSYYQQSTGYADQKIADLINGAPSTLDTLGEIADAMAENANVVEALAASIGSKASEAEFDSHVKDKSAHITTAERNGWNDPSPVFIQAGTRANIASGEKLSVLMGKIKKFFADLKAVAFSGSYNDLSDKPAIPTVGNGTVTVTQDGVTVGAFTLNQSNDITIPIAGGSGSGCDEYASKTIYGDTAVNMGRANNSIIGENSFAFGNNVTASGNYSHAEGSGIASGKYSHAEGSGIASETNSHAEGIATSASGEGSHSEGNKTIASGHYSHAEGYGSAAGNCAHAEGHITTAHNYASHASGKFNKDMTTRGSYTNQIGDVFVIGNGYYNGANNVLSNALRVTYKGEILGTQSFKSSGADYAEFIKPWADGNPNNEDRVGYFVTVKNGLLHKANEGDYIVGITSGNPSVVGNADEDYYWKYERDEFNRIIMEDVAETIQKIDENGELVFDENNEPIMIETGNMIKDARMKLSNGYDSSLQDTYIERKDRKEWDYVGMVGVLPVRDDGTCIAGQFCKCGNDGIATLAKTRSFDTYMVIERISENIISVIMKS